MNTGSSILNLEKVVGNAAVAGFWGPSRHAAPETDRLSRPGSRARRAAGMPSRRAAPASDTDRVQGELVRGWLAELAQQKSGRWAQLETATFGLLAGGVAAAMVWLAYSTSTFALAWPDFVGFVRLVFG